MFSCEFYQIFQNAIFAKQIWVIALAKHPFFHYVNLSHKKMFPSTLVILNIFQKTLWIACKQPFAGVLEKQSVVTKSIYW